MSLSLALLRKFPPDNSKLFLKLQMMVLLESYSEKLEKLSSEKLPNPFFILTAEKMTE